MASIFDTQSIDIPCPKCGTKHSKLIGWIKANSHIACGCGVSIKLEKDGLISELAKVDRSLASIPRNITIKF